MIAQVYSSETDEWDLWNDLEKEVWGHACTRVDDLVVVAGGVDNFFTIISYTVILDLNTREERVIGDLVGPRAWFGMATLDDRVLAFGGMSPLYDRDSYSDIQMLDMDTEQWIVSEEGLETSLGISSFATAVVYMDQVCSNSP